MTCFQWCESDRVQCGTLYTYWYKLGDSVKLLFCTENLKYHAFVNVISGSATEIINQPRTNWHNRWRNYLLGASNSGNHN